MTRIVHDEGTYLHLLPDEGGHCGVAVSISRLLYGVGVPQYFLHVVARIVAFHHLCHSFGIVHVAILVAIVAHHDDGVLPGTGLCVQDIADGLVDSGVSIFGRTCGDSSYGYVYLVGEHVGSLTIVEQTEIVIADVALRFAEGVVALVAEEEVIGRCREPLLRAHAVVPGTVAKEKKEAWTLRNVIAGTVVEHLHVAAVGIGVRCATGELIEQLVGYHDIHAQAVVVLMELLQPFCLRCKVSVGRDDDDHVGLWVGVEVLIVHVSH